MTRDRKVGRGRVGRRRLRRRRHGRAGCPAATRSTPRSPSQADRGPAEADLVVFVVDVRPAPVDEDHRRRAGSSSARAGPCSSSSTRSTTTSREADDLGVRRPRARRAAPGERPARARRRGPARRDRRARSASGRRAGARRAPRRAAAARGARRAAQRRQVDARSTALIGDERRVVHDVPGTTRDAVDTVVDTPDGPICFVDTAGMRRRAQDRGAALETYAVLRSLEALDRADLALLVIDATVGATAQDQRLAERIAAAGCPAVVVLNKWDLIATERPRPTCSRRSPTAWRSSATRPSSRRRASRAGACTGCCRRSRRGRRLRPPRPDGAAQPRAARPAGAPRRARPAGSATRPGRDRPADLHALRLGAALPALPSLRRARRCASGSTSARRRFACG